ncbi:DNA methyltransferase [Xylocopilactobacillus apis]|uniref:DNA modification methylase n=1 Tax=Xylocopilactobacillus apis TaxID=2932183 RepID=A0AAU9DCC9_9LACO|nr:DNA methyltransferase [Xylocopilactobacillus apis]BDR57435.1 DNA modification methylase [Xylocopilactobacillus apis]
MNNTPTIDYSWDFKGIKKEGVHTLGHYPATMVAPMQLRLLEKWKTNDEQIMLDPFMGSGTALIEAQKLGLQTIGIDINPYAVLLSQVKTHNYQQISWKTVIKRITKKLNSDEYARPLWNFEKIEKWFRPDIIESLSHVRNVIASEKDRWVRKFLWICMSDIIYTHSNDRTSTFKLHVKEPPQIERISNNVTEAFLNLAAKKQKYLNNEFLPKCTIYSGDAKKICFKLPAESVDIICSSPPYGENATTVTYGQASILFLKWIDPRDLEDSDNLLENFSKIDSKSLGGNSASDSEYSSKALNDFLSSINVSKQRKVRRFFSDYWLISKELARLLKPSGVLLYTVGNRKVDDIRQPLDKITVEMFESLGLEEVEQHTRNIFSKKMPSQLSRVHDSKPVKSMHKENILVFRKS